MNSQSAAVQVDPIPCPCCEQPVRVPTCEMVVFRYNVSPFQARILEAVWRGRGLPVPALRIFDEMYRDDPDGGPSEVAMYASLKAGMHLLRGKLAGSGVSVESAGYGRGWRLVMGGTPGAA